MQTENEKTTMAQQITELLKNTTEISCYLDLLKIINTEYLVVLGVKDTPGSAMSASIVGKIRALGFSKFDKPLWLMYAGIAQKSAVLLDKSGEAPETPVCGECDAEGVHVSVVSESYRRGNRVQIVINGTDYAAGGRGVNIVVYDTDSSALVDSVSFDCHDEPAGVFFRKGRETVVCANADVETRLTQIEKNLRSLNEIKSLMNLYDTQNKLMLWQAMARHYETVSDAKKRFFMSMPKAEGTLRKMQLAGTILLKKFDEVCRANSIPYWISFGTLLGAVRHRGFIPWDDDTDVCMMRGDAERLTRIMEDDKDFFVSCRFFTDENSNETNKSFQFKYRENLYCCLDIFIYDYINDISPENVKAQSELHISMRTEASSIKTSGLSEEEKQRQCSEILDRYLVRSRETVGTTDTPSKYIIWAIDNVSDIGLKRNFAVDIIFPTKPSMFEGIELQAPSQSEVCLSQIYGDIYSLPADMLSHKHYNLNDGQVRLLDNILAKYADMLDT